VRFVGDLIEVGQMWTHGGTYGWNMDPNAGNWMLTWERINASADGLPVDEDKLDP
jgi:hypothetical protein